MSSRGITILSPQTEPGLHTPWRHLNGFLADLFRTTRIGLSRSKLTQAKSLSSTGSEAPPVKATMKNGRRAGMNASTGSHPKIRLSNPSTTVGFVERLPTTDCGPQLYHPSNSKGSISGALCKLNVVTLTINLRRRPRKSW
ncbi:hypothetical protein PGTUg99_000814 [Puccinia graminis f. sp. tritici]|uniref:Uncharacterized protein n=1 Tax=Puccinia graminis f. sp. tritici TaxID=56615 RepID=A0A5B0PSC6_PUCGR|nr:hypothetical protein PGTUg99_000814 [Puccinia graminis f. sp. tritici]